LLTLDLSALDFAKSNGLVTVVVQDDARDVVLMVAHADREALERTLATGEMHFHSRSRGLWHKGATSGNTQRVVSLVPDCDGDSLLARVQPAGPACHTGATSCFKTTRRSHDALHKLDTVIAARASAPSNEADPSYTKRLLADRNLRLKKLGEEAAELVLACADEDRARRIEEAADLLYHTLVALRALGVGLTAVEDALSRRQR